MMLADMGADVIKVEKLPGGDDARGYREPRVNGVSAPFLMMNRNKRGIALNLKHPQGREILLRLVRDADVLTENYRRGTLEKLGLGYDVLAAGQSRAHLLRDLRLRPRRPARRQGRLRPDRAGLRRTDVDHRRAGRPAGQERQSGRRHQRRHPRRRRASLAAYAHKLQDRPRPDRRHVADGSRAAADLLARGDPLRDRRIARARPARRIS